MVIDPAHPSPPGGACVRQPIAGPGAKGVFFAPFVDRPATQSPVDAATILVPLATFIPGVSDLLRSSPVLRLVRLARLLTLGVRASGVMVREAKSAAAPVKTGPVQVHMLPGLGATAPRLTTWEEFVRWAKQPQAGWYSVANVGEHTLAELELATGIPADFIFSHLFGTSYPRLEETDRFISLFVWVPQMTAGQSH